MTFSELLEELKQVDPDTWDVIVRGIPLHESLSEALLIAYIAAIREEDKHVNNTCNNKGNDGTL